MGESSNYEHPRDRQIDQYLCLGHPAPSLRSSYPLETLLDKGLAGPVNIAMILPHVPRQRVVPREGLLFGADEIYGAEVTPQLLLP
jgi:hypothetical protein